MTSDAKRKKSDSRRPIISPHSHGYTSKQAILSVSALLLLSPSGAQTSESPDQYPPFKNFSTSTAAIIVILIAALFLLGFFTIYARNNCSDSAPDGRLGSFRFSLRLRRRGGGAPQGLDQAAIETFPTLVYSTVKGLKMGKGSLECAICLNDFEDDETLRLLIPRCDHVFHPECIGAWLASHVTCPVCRANLVPQPGESLRVPELNDSVETRNLPDEEVSVRVIEDPEQPLPPPPVIDSNRPPRSLSARQKLFAKFSESHSTGHSLVQPGENTDRFTLRLPEDVRKQVMSRALNRTMSCVALPREASSRSVYRTGFGEGNSRGWRSNKGLDQFDRIGNSDRWVFSMAPPFFSRAASFRSTKVMAADGEDSTSVESPSLKREDRKSEEPSPASMDSDRTLV